MNAVLEQNDADRIADLHGEIEFLERELQLAKQRALTHSYAKDVAESKAALAGCSLSELIVFSHQMQGIGDPQSAFNKFAAQVESVARQGFRSATGHEFMGAQS